MNQEQQSLRGGACLDLLPEVADKYFMSNGVTDRFEHLTAKAICGQCAVRAACLAEAIENPTHAGVRGGESGYNIWVLSYEHRQEGTPIDRLVRRVVGRQRPLQGMAWDQPKLRTGQFETVALARPVRGAYA